MINRIKILMGSHKKTTAVLAVAVAGIAISLFLKKGWKEPDHDQTAVTWLTIARQNAVVSVQKYGKITTSHNVSIPAPFEGKIEELNFNLGDKVTKGQKLVVFSTESVLKKQHEAKSDFLKKQEEYELLRNWETGSDVQKARQSLANAEQQLKTAERKLKDDYLLYEKGIIAGDELNQQKQQVTQQQQQIDSEKLALADIKKKGDEDNLLIAKFAMQDSKSALAHINEQISRAVTIAPVSGIALKPLQSSGKEDGSFEASIGESVTENQNILTIGNSENLEVKGSLNQEEINQIKINTPVKITSDAFTGVTLNGVIDSISRLASENDSSLPSFPFIVKLNSIPDKERKLMRIGIMVEIQLEVYRNDKAIVVPLAAIYQEKGKDYVWLRKDREVKKHYVTRGPSLPDGIVVEKGLKDGDVVRVENL